MNEQARIGYWLSDRGRRDSLRHGGDGKRQQTAVGLITTPDDLDLFDVDDEGRISFDASVAPIDFEPDGKRHSSFHAPAKVDGVGRIDVLWDVVPTWHDLLEFARWVHWAAEQHDRARQLEWEAEHAAIKKVTHDFLADPNARAEKLAEDHVTIAGRDFWSNTDPVVVEARARAARDDEELKKANRATLAKWTAHHGTSNQRQRLAAGLLPWKEIYEAAEAQLYVPLASFPLYKRFELQEVCKCAPDGRANVKFQSVDTVELTAEEWEQYSKVRAAVPRATFQLREHRAA